MATVYAITDGLWSDGTTWDGGVVPAAVDDVFSNGQTVYLDQDITASSLRNYSSGSIANGGTFSLSGCNTINADLLYGGVSSSLVTVPANVDSNLTVSGNIYCDSSSFNTSYGINWQSTSGSLGIVGDVYFSNNPSFTPNYPAASVYMYNLGQSSSIDVNVSGAIQGGLNSQQAIYIYNSNVNVSVVGSIQGGKHLFQGTNNTPCYGLYFLDSSGNIFIEGDTIGGGPYSYGYAHAVRHQGSAGSITLVGNASGINGGTGYGLYIYNSSAPVPINITGNIYGKGLYDNSYINNLNITGDVYGDTYGPYNGVTAYVNSVNVVGNIYSGTTNSARGMYVDTTGVLNVTGNIYGDANSTYTSTNCALQVYGNGSATINTVGQIKAGRSSSSLGYTDNRMFQNTHGLGIHDAHTINISGDLINDLGTNSSARWNSCLAVNNGLDIPNRSLTVNGNVMGAKYGAAMYGILFNDTYHTMDITINGNISTNEYNSNADYSNHGMYILQWGTPVSSSGSTITINGNLIRNGARTSNTLYTDIRNNHDDIIVNGSILPFENSNSTTCIGIYSYYGGKIQINGDVYNGDGGANDYSAGIHFSPYSSSGTSCEVNGNLYMVNNINSSYGNAIRVDGFCDIVVNGDVHSSGQSPTVLLDGQANLFVYGDVYQSKTSSYGVISFYRNTGLVHIEGDIYTDGSESIVRTWSSDARGNNLYFYGNIHNTGNNGTREVFSIPDIGNCDITLLNEFKNDFGLIYTGNVASSSKTLNVSGVIHGSISSELSTIYINTMSDLTVNLYGEYYSPQFYSTNPNTTCYINNCSNSTVNVHGTINGAGTDVKVPFFLHSNNDETFKINYKKIIAPSGYWPIKNYTSNDMKPERHGFLESSGVIISSVDDNDNPINLVTSSSVADFPSQDTVKSGTSYDNGAKLGILAVPDPSHVSYNTPVGTGVGTAVLDQESLLSALGLSSGNFVATRGQVNSLINTTPMDLY